MGDFTAVPMDDGRFTKSDNPVIALESTIIIFLCAFIIWLIRRQDKKDKETNDTLLSVAAAVNILTGVVNAKK